MVKMPRRLIVLQKLFHLLLVVAPEHLLEVVSLPKLRESVTKLNKIIHLSRIGLVVLTGSNDLIALYQMLQTFGYRSSSDVNLSNICKGVDP